MKRFCKMFLVAVPGMLLFWGCHRADSPVEYGFGPEGPVPLMDRRVVGEWVRVSSGTHGAPYVSGWQITAGEQLYDLGVKFSTGRLTRLPNAPVHHFQALDGKFRITRKIHEAHEYLLMEGRYEVTDEYRPRPQHFCFVPASRFITFASAFGISLRIWHPAAKFGTR